MKLAPRTFRIEWELHAWAGVVASLLLFVMFFCGLFALFHDELSLWQEPAQRSGRAEPPSFGQLLAALEREAPLARGASVSYAVQPGMRFASLAVTAPGATTGRAHVLDVDSLRPSEPQSHLADELLELHYLEQLPLGGELAGLLAVGLLVSVISGFLIHLKDLRRQWLQLRPRLPMRFVASDVHKLIGVFAIPFMLVLGWSGSLLCLGELTLAGVAHGALDGDEKRTEELHYGPTFERAASGKRAHTLAVDPLVARAVELSGQQQPASYLELHNVYDQHAWLAVFFPSEELGSYPFVFLDAVTGRVLQRSLDAPVTPAAAFDGVLHGLHFAQFGGFWLKLLYAAFALGTCVVLISGNLVWLERRDPCRERPGSRLLERATVALPGGLVAATGMYFLANRALPATLDARAELEFVLFASAWAVFAALGLLLQATLARRSFALACLATSLFALTLVLDLAVQRNGLARGHEVLPALWQVQVVLALLTAACAGLALLCRPRTHGSAARSLPSRAEGAHQQPLEL